MNDQTSIASDNLGAPEADNREPDSLSAFRHKAHRAGFDEAETERLIADYYYRIEDAPHGHAAKRGRAR